MSGTTGDVLTQARTPTEAETEAGQAASAFADGHWEKAATRAVLAVAAPRILALAYREAARKVIEEQQAASQYGELFTAHKAAQRLLALATALEEGQ